jgi:hypothetical protein
MEVNELDPPGSGQGETMGSYEYSNEPLASTEMGTSWLAEEMYTFQELFCLGSQSVCRSVITEFLFLSFFSVY